MTIMKKVKVAVIQFQSRLKDKEYNLRYIIELIEQLKGMNIVCLPEFFTTGYGLKFRDFLDLADTIPGGTTKTLEKLSAKKDLIIIGGIVERDEKIEGVLYDSAFVIDNGEFIGKYRKDHLYPAEHQFFKQGDDIPIFETSAGRIGLAICYDHAFPELFRILALKGAELIVVPSCVPIGYEYLLKLRTRARGQDNQLFVIGANSCAKEGETKYCGNSMIVDPRGEIIAQAGAEEEIIIGEIDYKEILKERMQEPVLRSRRVELYKEMVNEV